MQIYLNGKKIETDSVMSLSDFLTLKGLEPDRIVVQYNFEIVRKEDRTRIYLKENDNLEILRLVGGG